MTPDSFFNIKPSLKPGAVPCATDTTTPYTQPQRHAATKTSEKSSIEIKISPTRQMESWEPPRKRRQTILAATKKR